MGDSPVLFRVLGLNVTAEVVTMWGVACYCAWPP